MDFRVFPTPLDPTRSSAIPINAVRKILDGAWEFDPEFYTKFFPVNADSLEAYQKVEKQLRRGPRWTGVPGKQPKSSSKLRTPLKLLLNGILRSFGLYEDARRVLDTSRKPIYPNLNYRTRPPLLIVGCGKYFTGSDAQRPMPDYGIAISVVEVFLDSDDPIEARDRLATHMHQLFIHQFNRRYAFGMVITQQTLTLYMFDRSGAVSSPRLDYHSNPVQFCAVIGGLASLEPVHIGLDTSISLDDGKGHIRTHQKCENGTLKDVVYTVETLLYYTPDFLRSGTTCFQAYEDTAPEEFFVVKDSWMQVGNLEGKESEASFLWHAQRCGVVKGIAQIRHSEEVQVKNQAGHTEVDSVLRNRQLPHDVQSKLQRVHTRIVVTPYGKPFDQFSSKKELLLAYHDAVQAHQALHDTAGILHRDVKPANILINPRGGDGGRGVLIDFDHAIRIDDSSPYSKKKNIGTHLFMSANALEGSEAHTFLDDLESFYYVIIYIVLGYTEPKVPTTSVHPLLRRWGEPLSFTAKAGFLLRDFREKVEPWFGTPFENLVKNLHKIFKTHQLQCIVAENNGRPPPVSNPIEFYTQFISAINRAILEVETEQANDVSHIATTEPPQRNISQEEGAEDDLYTWDIIDPRDHREKDIPHTAAASRPRRSCASYGITEPSRQAILLKTTSRTSQKKRRRP